MPDLQLVEVLPDAVLQVSGVTVQYANAAARRWLGRDALVGLTLAELLDAGELARLSWLLERLREGWGPTSSYQLRFRGADGESLQSEVRLTDMGERGFVLVARDVTDMRRAKTLMGRLALLSSDSPRIEGATQVLEASAPVFEALGWVVAFTEVYESTSITRRVLAPEDHPVGAHGRSLVDKELPFAQTPVLAEAVRRDEAIFLDDIPLLAQGPERNATALAHSMLAAHLFRSAWCPIRDGAHITHMLAVTGRDLTTHDFVALQLFAAHLGASMRLARLRTELVHHERLAAVGEMAAVLAHEVRSPLSVMYNAVNLLRRADASDERRELYAVLGEEAERLNRLVADLLTFTGPTQGTRSPLAIDAVLRAAVEQARHDASFLQRLPKVQVLAPSDLPMVLADPEALRRAVVNLVVNAFQHVEPHGAVEVRAQRDGGLLRVCVHNEGQVPDLDVQARLFEPFFTTKAQGTGLGLAIVRKTARSLGGDVRFVPSPRGPIFELSLPADLGAP